MFGYIVTTRLKGETQTVITNWPVKLPIMGRCVETFTGEVGIGVQFKLTYVTLDMLCLWSLTTWTHNKPLQTANGEYYY